MIRNPAVKTFAVIIKIVLMLVVVFGIAGTFSYAKNGSDVANDFFYFTNQSNLIVLAVAGYGVYRLLANKPEGRLAAFIRNGAMFWILITGLVFHFMVAGAYRLQAGPALISIALHYVSPLLVLANWLLFEEKGRCRYVHLVYWMAYPILYVAVSEIRFAFDGFAPYWFLDPVHSPPRGTGSAWVMLAIVAAMVAFFGLVGLLIVRIDRFWRKRPEQQSAAI